MTAQRTMTRRDRALLWAAVAGPVTAWGIHLIGAYGYEEAACSTGTGTGLIEPVFIGLTIVLLPVAAALGMVALSLHRAVSRGELHDPRGRVGFMAATAALAALLFAAMILLQGIQVVGLAPCEP